MFQRNPVKDERYFRLFGQDVAFSLKHVKNYRYEQFPRWSSDYDYKGYVYYVLHEL